MQKWIYLYLTVFVIRFFGRRERLTSLTANSFSEQPNATLVTCRVLSCSSYHQQRFRHSSNTVDPAS